MSSPLLKPAEKSEKYISFLFGERKQRAGPDRIEANAHITKKRIKKIARAGEPSLRRRACWSRLADDGGWDENH